MEKLQASMVLEILGRPKEHVKEALSALISKLDSEKGIKVLEKTIHDAIPVENTKDLFTTFAEITIELESLHNYFGILFAYMPSNIELISPQKIDLTNLDLNDLGNKLISRLHDYDAITKKTLYENEILVKKLKEIAPNLFKQPEASLSQTQGKNKNTNLKNKKSRKNKKNS